MRGRRSERIGDRRRGGGSESSEEGGSWEKGGRCELARKRVVARGKNGG